MRIFDFKHLILLLAALVLLGACGKHQEISTDFIREDERSWKEQDVEITKDPHNPENTIIKDEYGITVIGPNGEVISQVIKPLEPKKEKAPKLEAPKEEVVDNDANYVLLPTQEEEDSDESEEHTHEEENITKPITSSWENFALAFPYADKAGEDQCNDYPSLRDVMDYGSSIEVLGGEFKDPSKYDYDLMGFTKFLTEVGVKHFTAYEMVTPGSKENAKTCKVELLLPKRGCWLRSAALGLVSDKIRGHQGSPVKMTSHFRTSCYNKLAGGSKSSDHLSSRAADLSFGSKELRKRAQDYICKTFWKDDLVGLKGLRSNNSEDLNISIGLGQSFMHVGFGSDHGRRYWIYSSYKKGGNENEGCWTWKL